MKAGRLPPRAFGVVCVALATIFCVAGKTTAPAKSRLSGVVNLDGSSTVAPIMLAAAELFRVEQPRVQVKVGISGSGGGFKKFLNERAELRTDIIDASRPINPAEVRRAAEVGVQFIEMPIAYDGIAVVVNPENDWCEALTITELRTIWEPGREIANWQDVRPGFPDVPLKLYAPGTDSGTFDYFVETVMGRGKACRSDFAPSEDDHVLVRGVAGDRGGLGYFGYSYFEANKGRLKLVGIGADGLSPVKPSLQTIRDGTYQPLSRPLFLYVNVEAAQRPEVKSFLRFIFSNVKRIVEHPTVNYVALSDELCAAIWARLERRVTGSAYADPGNRGKSLREIYVGREE